MASKKDFSPDHPTWDIRTDFPFEIIFDRDVTKKQHERLCKLIGLRFQIAFDDDDYEFARAGCHEGGIEIVKMPTFRDGCLVKKEMRYGLRYPWEQDIAFSFGNDDCILIKKGSEVGIKLKSHGSTPNWTQAELDVIEECYEVFGGRVKYYPNPWGLAQKQKQKKLKRKRT